MALARRVSSKKSGKTSGSLFANLGELFQRMEKAYDLHAKEAGLTCMGCESNCCTSYFRHHTYIEWIYLLKGVQQLSRKTRKKIEDNAHSYLQNMQERLAANEYPDALCPLNEQGLCILYSHRLMICRMHGTRNMCRMPDGTVHHFAGCGKYVANAQQKGLVLESLPALDRTPFYQELAYLEQAFYKKAGTMLPRVNLTIAEMLVMGPPQLR